MGLFDGYDNMAGSSAELAGLLHLPVILVVNAGRPLTPSQQSSMVSNISVPISKSQELYSTSSVPNRITPTCNKPAGMPASKHWDICPNAKASKYPPGHLGLNIDSEFCFDEFADRIACQVEQTVDIDRLLDICSCATAPSSCLPGKNKQPCQ